MKLSNKVFLNKQFTDSISKVAASRIPAFVAWKLLKIIQILEKESAAFNTTLNTMIFKYGVPDGKGGASLDPKSDKYQSFKEEMKPIEEAEFEIPIEEKIKLSAKMIQNPDGTPVLFSVSEITGLVEIIDLEE